MTQRGKGQRVVDLLLQIAGLRPIRLHPVGVLPVGKGAGALNISKLLPGFIVAVLGLPAQPYRPLAYA